MKPVICCTCGIEFGLPEVYANARYNDHKAFYCPNGHGLSWPERKEKTKPTLVANVIDFVKKDGK